MSYLELARGSSYHGLKLLRVKLQYQMYEGNPLMRVRVIRSQLIHVYSFLPKCFKKQKCQSSFLTL